MGVFDYECDGQISIFDILEPKKDKTPQNISYEIFLSVIKSGTSFENGKKRVYEMYGQCSTQKERIKRIKEEYGVGGSSLHGEYFRRGFQNHDAKGIEIELDGIKLLYSWEKVEKEIHKLIDSGEYYKPPEQKYKCLGKDCNHYVLIEVAKDLGYECKFDCCLKCSSRFCGARCNYSINK